MAFSEQERRLVDAEVASYVARRRPPPELRDRVDLGYRIDGQSVVLFEVRPRFLKPSERHELPVARTTFVRTKGVWKVYWQRADLKWHRYDPAAAVRSLRAFLNVVEQDVYGCFWG